MKLIVKIDKSVYRCISPEIETDEVILTSERIEHIRKNHPESVSVIIKYRKDVLEDPDYILRDGKSQNTGIVLKRIRVEEKRILAVVRIHTKTDRPEYKNSILSGWTISETRWDNYLRNKEILYKSKRNDV